MIREIVTSWSTCSGERPSFSSNVRRSSSRISFDQHFPPDESVLPSRLNSPLTLPLPLGVAFEHAGKISPLGRACPTRLFDEREPRWMKSLIEGLVNCCFHG